MPVLLHAPTSVGDVLDRLTILALKRAHATGEARFHVEREQEALAATWAAAGLPEALPEREALAEVNARLWAVEDALREAERAGRFDDAFVQLARSVYTLNDRRAALKRAVNERLGSALVEVKLHPVG